MPFYTDNTIERMMAFNSFGSRFDPQSIPSYDDWVVNNTFDPFGPEPFAPTLYANPGIPIHPRTRDGFCPEEGMDVDSRFDRGYGSSEVDMTRNFPQEVGPYPPMGDHKSNANRPYRRGPDLRSHRTGSNAPPTGHPLVNHEFQFPSRSPPPRCRELSDPDLFGPSARSMLGGNLPWPFPKPCIPFRHG